MTTTFGAQLDLEIPAATMAFEVKYVERASIYPDPAQPRKEPDAELLESIRTNGMLQPITVRPHPEKVLSWMIIDGERRWRGAEGILEEVPVIVREDLGDRVQRLQTQLVSNVGKPLTPIEEARAFAELMSEHGSIASLARALGRPERSIGERLQLLELGPWLTWIEDGRLPLSHAVKILLPLRGCAEKVHAHAMERIAKDYRFERNDKEVPGGISVSDFANLVRQAYEPSLYPLAKTKSSYGKQPLFDTKNHDAECDCGRISFTFSAGDQKRACCGNPGWWRPLHRKAIAAKPKKKSSSSNGQRERPAIYAPEGSSTAKVRGYNDELQGAEFVTASSDVKWDATTFDPSTVPFAPEKLVLVERPYAAPRMATKELGLVKAAREQWATRWHDRRNGLIEALRRALKPKAKDYRVAGPGLIDLLHDYVKHTRDPRVIIDAAEAANVAVPPALVTKTLDGGWHSSHGTTVKWVTDLDGDASAVATALSYLLGTNTKSPSQKVAEEIAAAQKKIQMKPLPWTKAPKSGATAKRKTKKGKGTPPPDESIDEDEDDEAGE